MPRFVHLHVHSHYSLLDGLGKIPELVARAKELGMDALALTDHGALYGALEFYQECQKQGIKPIIGMEAYIAPNGMTEKRARVDEHSCHLTLLAQTVEGYKNLIQITTAAHLEGFYYKPRVDKEFLRKHSAGIIALSGCLNGEISRALQAGDEEKANRLLAEYRDIFGAENFYIEVQDHGEMPEQRERNAQLVALARTTGTPIVATKDCHYIHPEDAEAQDILLAIQTGKHTTDPTRLSMLGVNYSLTSPDEMSAAFADIPEAVENSVKIAERCVFTLELGKWNFPPVDIPEGKTASGVLRERAEIGLRTRYGEHPTEEARTRLEYELGIIETKGYAPYFLAVADAINWAKQQGIITTTRGSAAGSLVSYSIGITTVDPLFFKLPFERFLNPFRPSPPDIDMDYADNRRDEVIAYVTEKYGRDRVAQICTFGTMLARAAVRDVARALGLPYSVGDRIAKLIPMGSQGFPMTLARALETTPELRDLLDSDSEARRVLDLAARIEGCVRHISVHAAGVVIGPRPLVEFTPLQRDPGGESIITQYEMYSVEAAGLLKMDFLGIRNLSILGRAVEIARATKGAEVNLERLPLGDQKTFDLLARGATVGLFQLGGSGMTRYLVELRPSSIHDIMAMVALYRPGPIESIPEYIRRKHNPKLVRVLDPRMKPILEQSYGIITYQDDVLLIAIELAGYTWEEADKLRKAIGKKIPKEMAAQKEKFIGGCVAGGMIEEKAQELWGLIETFAAYGFNKAHAASYGMVAYQTAYMKANFPAEYMTAVLSAESGDLEKVAEAVAECKKMGIEVLPPEVNESRQDFTMVDDRHIRFGLNAVKNLGTDVVKAIIGERKERGQFHDLSDFLGRVQARSFNKKSLESLIMSGAMDSMGERSALLWNIDDLLAANREMAARRASGQSSLFGGGDSVGPLCLRPTSPATKRDKLAWEKELLGLYVTEHPFAEIARALPGALTPLSELGAASKGSVVTSGGVISEVKAVTTKAGERMAFLRLADETATVETIVFPRLFASCAADLREDTCVLVVGKRSEKDEDVRYLADRIVPVTPDSAREALSVLIGEIRANLPAGQAGPQNPPTTEKGVTIEVLGTLDENLSRELKVIFSSSPGPARVFLRLGPNGSGRMIETQFRISWTPEVQSRIAGAIGSARGVRQDLT
ncbi:DNA polymerase III subunit alpha [Candidatus Uhrbacteria bacterium RIFCSPHIGHO2_02_FULL_57_19]|uniref:DNA polymerase III subunit alpha n=1 Tax=Candidatus Uhrbacteria bacterium RIFCSPHIGHO2_02_FULL_57_19 TaxID=1802391 RepID=A0A1F7U3G2_9BACT|nr:MAG: DNA polymerase III subunit alpha [Candidatus Uhrbacteria bacterium RIFCSPHIGHO2_02_FULL_57_19]